MADIPEDLTSIGTHRGNQPPTKTGQTVRSPDGPDPRDKPAEASPALYQLVRSPEEDRLQIRTHSPRAVVPEPDDGEEVGQYRTVQALREALDELSLEGWTAVFEDTEANRALVEPDVHSDHAWIGQPRYPTITFFEDDEAANQFAEDHERPVSTS